LATSDPPRNYRAAELALDRDLRRARKDFVELADDTP